MVNEDKIQEILTRGVERIYPSAEFLRERLLSGEKLLLYLGIDPTGTTLHLGHIIPLLKLRQFQELGHKVTLLVGDFTATIGDPTDKLAPRVALSAAQVDDNAKGYGKQATRILPFTGENPAVLRRNSEWLNKLPMSEMFALLSNLTYAQIIKRDMFQERINQGRDLNVNELLYPALQGYDSVALNVDGEVGGNDQTFNMLMGRDLLKKLRGKEKFVVAMKLLADSSGKKMGKTEGNMVALDEKPEEMFGKIMSWSDTMIASGFELCTNLPVEKIEEIKRLINPKEQKMELAYWVTRMLYDGKHAVEARDNFIKKFSERGVPKETPTIKVTEHQLLIDVVLQEGVVTSKTEFRRLVGEGAVTILESGEKITDPASHARAGTYRIGKHRFLKVIV